MNGEEYVKFESIVRSVVQIEMKNVDFQFKNIIDRLDKRHEICMEREARVRDTEKSIENIKGSQRGMFALAQVVAGIAGGLAGLFSGFLRGK